MRSIEPDIVALEDPMRGDVPTPNFRVVQKSNFGGAQLLKSVYATRGH